jgi:hypothetical protein
MKRSFPYARGGEQLLCVEIKGAFVSLKTEVGERWLTPAEARWLSSTLNEVNGELYDRDRRELRRDLDRRTSEANPARKYSPDR